MKFRTKPFEIEAEQYDGTEQCLERFIVMSAAENSTFKPRLRGRLRDGNLFPVEVYDYLQDTWVKVNYGDYIIKGMKNEYYPCDPQVFETKYEPVSDAVGTATKFVRDYEPYYDSDFPETQ